MKKSSIYAHRVLLLAGDEEKSIQSTKALYFPVITVNKHRGRSVTYENQALKPGSYNSTFEFCRFNPGFHHSQTFGDALQSIVGDQ